jgi:hypothetical protein
MTVFSDESTDTSTIAVQILADGFVISADIDNIATCASVLVYSF